MNVSLTKSCSFFGHTKIDITDKLVNDLKILIKKLITEDNFQIFYFGGFSNFDELCWQIVSEIKQEFPLIKRIFCLSNPQHLRPSKRPKFLKENDYEEFVYLDLDFDWWYKRIYFRNIEIINKSDFVVFFVSNVENSGAYKAMQHAKKIKKPFINFGTI